MANDFALPFLFCFLFPEFKDATLLRPVLSYVTRNLRAWIPALHDPISSVLPAGGSRPRCHSISHCMLHSGLYS
ncbi:uncharacterized protein BDV17DRAFT_267953 [Aspergillus undulatus]|uniref:uncharacterized protein n=1 Tax=Aspergillus undulatus TaxID=1810928 RepID=UPI003CCCD47B